MIYIMNAIIQLLCHYIFEGKKNLTLYDDQVMHCKQKNGIFFDKINFVQSISDIFPMVGKLSRLLYTT